MRDFVDRVPKKANRKKITPETGGAAYYATVDYADEPTTNGTNLNRSAFMGMQGMENCTTVFASTSITETYPTGTLVTTFNTDGSITETFTGQSGLKTTKKTVFQSNGNIQVTVS